MIDIHCHILPKVDDGADCMATACEMAAMATQTGVRIIVATPHSNHHGRWENFRSDALQAQFQRLQAVLQKQRIPIQILPGAEILVRRNLQQLLAQKKLQTINNTKYLLVEFYFDATPAYMDERLRLIRQYGYIPIIAHPERYQALACHPALAAQWFSQGYVLQLNKGSLLGQLGKQAQEVAEFLLHRGLAHVIASDAHHYLYRTTDTTELLLYLSRHCPESYAQLLLSRNPQRIIQGKPLDVPAPPSP